MPPGLHATRPEAADFGHTLPVHAKGLAKIRGFGEALGRQTCLASSKPDYADPPFEAGFAISGSGLAASRKWSRARSGFRAQPESARLSPAHQPDRPQRLRRARRPA